MAKVNLSYEQKYDLVKQGKTYNEGAQITLTDAEFAKIKMQAQLEILERANQSHLKDEYEVVVHKSNKSPYGPNQMRAVPKKQAKFLVDKAPKDWVRYKSAPEKPVGVESNDDLAKEIARLKAENEALKAKASTTAKTTDAKVPAAQKTLPETNSPVGGDEGKKSTAPGVDSPAKPVGNDV